MIMSKEDTTVMHFSKSSLPWSSQAFLPVSDSYRRKKATNVTTLSVGRLIACSAFGHNGQQLIVFLIFSICMMQCHWWSKPQWQIWNISNRLLNAEMGGFAVSPWETILAPLTILQIFHLRKYLQNCLEFLLIRRTCLCSFRGCWTTSLITDHAS